MSAEFTQEMSGEPEETELTEDVNVEGGVRTEGGGELRQLLEKMQTGGASEDEEEPAIEYPQEATTAPYSYQNQQEVPQVPQDSDIKGNPYARARVLERDNKKLRQKQAELESKLDRVLSKLGGEDEPQEEQEPEDPVEKLYYGMKKITEEQKEIKQSLAQEREMERIAALQEDANEQIRGYSQKVDMVAPGAYKGAVAHLANMWISELIEDSDMSAEEAQYEVAKKAEHFKLKWRSEGKDPGEEFLKRSIATGYRFQVSEPQQQRPNVTQQIKREAKKRNGVASISGMSGAPSKNPLKRVVSSTLSADSGREYHRTMSEMAKARGGYNKRIPLSEILADRMIQGS